MSFTSEAEIPSKINLADATNPQDSGSAPQPHGERRTQIKLSATPNRRAIPAVIAASADDSMENHPGDADAITTGSDSAFAEIASFADAVGGDILFALDRALRFAFANRAAESLLGRNFDSLRGRPLAALAPDAGKGESALVVRLRDVLREGRADTFDMVFDSTGRNYRIFATPYPEGVFVCLRDLTDQITEINDLREDKRLLEQMLEIAPEIIYIYDLSLGVNVYANRNVALSLGYMPEEMEAMSAAQLATLTAPEDIARQKEQRDKLRTTATVEYEYRRRNKSGATRWIRATETVFGRDANGAPRLLLGFARDVTDRRRMLEMLRQREEYLRRLTESSPDCILTLDLNGGMLQINQSGKTLMEIGDFAPLVGAEWTLLFQENYRSLAIRALAAAQRGGTERFQGIAKTAVGTPIWWDVVVTPLNDADGKPTRIVTVARDISQFKALEAERERLLEDAITRADYDPLTGLLNHRAFHRKLQEAAGIDASKRSSVAILLLDLENFRYFNEAYGRAIGDELLIRMAQELAGCCRASDLLARVGPDEFGILAPRMEREEVAPYVMRLRAAIDNIGMRSPDGSDIIPLHISVGYALFPQDTDSVATAYDIAEERQRADQAGGYSREAERVRESLRETVDSFGMLDTLIATIDAKDRLTRRQSEDTMIYSRRIAARMGLTDEQMRSLDIAALLYDVGKVGIDERILRQPGKLSEADFAIVQQHPKIGAMLVGSTVDDVDTVEAILYHHENWDGSGYPTGLSGDEIPLPARILSVASSYAAMTNNRPYRKGMTPTIAQKVLQNGAGTQWDPECVGALIAATNGGEY